MKNVWAWQAAVDSEWMEVLPVVTQLCPTQKMAERVCGFGMVWVQVLIALTLRSLDIFEYFLWCFGAIGLPCRPTMFFRFPLDFRD